MGKIIEVCFRPEDEYYKRASESKLTQWSYGHILRIIGLDLPDPVEIHFSLEERQGKAFRTIGRTVDGATQVAIPPFIMEGPGHVAGDHYKAYAFIYVGDAEYGETIRRIELRIDARPRPTEWVHPTTLEEFMKLAKMVAEEVLDGAGNSFDETAFVDALADAGFITILTDENGNILTDENGNTLIAKGPEANHNPDWNETDESSPSFILNKPTGMGGGYTYYVISNNWLYKASNPSEANDSNLIKNIKTFEQDYLSGPIMLHMKNMANDRTYFPCIAFAISDSCYVNYTYPGNNVSKHILGYDRNTGNLI